MSEAESRIVSLDWDRGHESLTAIVRAESPSGVVLTEVDDLAELPGRRWIRADEVVELEDLEPDDPARRVAELRGSLLDGTVAEPTDIEALLGHLQDTSALVAVYSSRTGSDECLVGSVERISPDQLVLTEIDTTGTITGGTVEISLDDVIAVDWGTAYLTALAELVG
jgi:hypothetical protein